MQVDILDLFFILERVEEKYTDERNAELGDWVEMGTSWVSRVYGTQVREDDEFIRHRPLCCYLESQRFSQIETVMVLYVCPHEPSRKRRDVDPVV